MRTTRSITIVHPEVKVRIALRSIFEAHACTVTTDHSLRDLASTKGDVCPDVILVDRAQVTQEGIEILTELNRIWEEAVIVFLPEGLTSDIPQSTLRPQLLGVVDRMLTLKSTREILSV